jgi:hypothetical protein
MSLPFRAQDVCDSQEAWWLRRGCRRARSRLIKGLADAFGIPVHSMQVRTPFSFNLALVHVVDREGLAQRALHAHLILRWYTSSIVKAWNSAPHRLQSPSDRPGVDGARGVSIRSGSIMLPEELARC